MAWPWPTIPDTHRGTCRRCGVVAWLIPVFVDHDDQGKPTGPFESLCYHCLRRDGGP